MLKNLPPESRKIVLPWIQGAAAGIVILWALFAVNAIWNYDLLTRRKEYSPVYLWLAIGGTILVPPVVYLKLRKDTWLYKNGVPTQARFVGTSPLRNAALVPTTLAYQVAGKEYKIKVDLDAEKVATFNDQTRITIYVDPRNPKSCMIPPRLE